MEEKVVQKIEKYLAGVMSPDEVAAFEKQMTADPMLQKEMVIYKQINEHLMNDPDRIQIPDNEHAREIRSFLHSEEAVKIKETISEGSKVYHAEHTKPSNYRVLWIAASIAILVALTIGYLNLSSSNPEQLYAQFYSKKDLPAVITRGGDNSLLEKGVIAFQEENYREALVLFETYKNEGDDLDLSVYLYAGFAYLEVNDLTNSLSNFDLFIQSNSLDASKGLWFKALAYLKNNNIEQAKSVLQIIGENSSNFKYSESKELLKKL